MHTPNTPEQNPHGLTPTGYNARTPGYETSDVKVGGIAVFLISLFVFLVIFFVFCFGMGKVINNALIKHDGPPNKWNTLYTGEARGKNLESNAALEQQQLQAMTARFPTPRLQMDDGDQDLVDLHDREDLLLDHYTWVNQQQGTVRIPIGRAMELIAQRGLPMFNGGPSNEPLMTADTRPEVTAPLTNGFARTGYEQELEVKQSRQQQEQKRQQESTGEQARLAPAQP